MSCYILCWEFGIHHINIETNKKDFYRVIDDLSNEFVIYKTFTDDQKDSIFYYIENYYGDMQQIGFSFEVSEVK